MSNTGRTVEVDISGPGIAALVVCLVAGFAASKLLHSPAPLLVAIAVGIYLMFSIKVVQQWQRVAILRFGRYRGLRGPGIFLIVPVMDTLSRFVDQRVRVATVTAESTLTRDTVPVNVDAIIFWMVWDAEKSILEVENFTDAVSMSAQTALRESIGRHELAQMITDRELLGRELQRILDEKTNPWGSRSSNATSVASRPLNWPASAGRRWKPSTPCTATGSTCFSWTFVCRTSTAWTS